MNENVRIALVALAAYVAVALVQDKLIGLPFGEYLPGRNTSPSA